MASLDPSTRGGKAGNGLPARADTLDTPGARTKRGIKNGELVDARHVVHPDSVHHASRPRTAANDVRGKPGKPLNVEQTRGAKNQRVK